MSQKNKLKRHPQQREMNPQSSSPFLRLPRELRNHIYVILFRSTRLRFGGRRFKQWEVQRWKPAHNSLAILRSCHQVYDESKDLWLGNVIFSFETAKDLMDKLSPLPRNTLSSIRHVRTSGQYVQIKSPGVIHGRYYFLPHVLKLLPGLRLDCLTVLGTALAETTYLTMEFFLKCGHGWKELRFICPDSEVLWYKEMNGISGLTATRREQQSGAWNEAILRRDGQESGASVIIHRSPYLDQGSVLRLLSREPFHQNIIPRKEMLNSGEPADQELLSDLDQKRELLIVVKRGRDADILNVGEIQRDGFDLREWAGGMTWEQIRKEPIEYSSGSHLSEDKDPDSADADIYDDPDEYQLPYPFKC